jgi:hypothetical protein
MLSHARNALLPLVLPALFLAAVLYIGFFNWNHKLKPENQTYLQGELVEWSLLPVSHQDKLIRFTIKGHANDFRIDPALFRAALGRKLPPIFRPGARIGLLADTSQIAAPIHPSANPSLAIVWVNGLSINGVAQFGVDDVVKHESDNLKYWSVLLAIATTFFFFAAYVWAKRRNSKVG